MPNEEIPKYLFRCKNCGEYPVTKRTFRKFTPEDKWQELEQRMAQNKAWGGLIQFDQNCPKCEPQGISSGTIRALRLKPEFAQAS